MTVGDALRSHYKENGIDPDEIARPTWNCQLGPLTLRLPNTRWRREAVSRHDLHHVLTGIPCTPKGECQMAAWEFAAGPFPNLFATMFCLPLVLLGAVWAPKLTFEAFLLGRRGPSLYRQPVAADNDIEGFRAICCPQTEVIATKRDVLTFLTLVACSLTFVSAGVFAALFILMVVFG